MYDTLRHALLGLPLLALLGCAPSASSVKERVPYTGTPYAYEEVDVKPEPIDGWQAIADEARYPEMAQRAGIEGTAIVNFVVDHEGVVHRPRVVRGIGGGTDEESLRVIRGASFRPAQLDGEPVDVAMSAELTFSLDGRNSAGPYVEP